MISAMPCSASVAMCTYNGAVYIKEQLLSIINQSVSPTQIIICDDRSTDETAQVIKKVSETTKIPIKLVVNAQNLGILKNFEKAISSCSGDIIFFRTKMMSGK